RHRRLSTAPRCARRLLRCRYSSWDRHCERYYRARCLPVIVRAGLLSETRGLSRRGLALDRKNAFAAAHRPRSANQWDQAHRPLLSPLTHGLLHRRARYRSRARPRALHLAGLPELAERSSAALSTIRSLSVALYG